MDSSATTDASGVPAAGQRGNDWRRDITEKLLKSSFWLGVIVVLQGVVGVLRLLTPRPLTSVANFFLVFLGTKPEDSPAGIKLFFLAFFSLILGLSDLFWLVMRFTGPFGTAWLEPKYYWRPLYASLYEHDVPGNGPNLNSHDHIRGHLLPPERPPAHWQIYIELVCYGLSPVICLLGAWLGWRVYKQRLPEIPSETEYFFSPTDINTTYGAAALYNSNAPEIPGASQHTDAPIDSQNPLLQGRSGSFVPFMGEGMKLGSTDTDTRKGEKPV